MAKAVFAGSFDPPTNGHLDIIERACKIFDDLDVVVSVNPQKHYMFSEEERVHMMSELVKKYPNVTVHVCKELIVNYAKKVNADVLVRVRILLSKIEKFRIKSFFYYLDNFINLFI